MTTEVETTTETSTQEFEGLLSEYNIAREMHKRMHEHFVGFRVTIGMPCSGRTAIDPAVVGVSASDVDQNIDLGHMATMPKWITNIGRTLSAMAYRAVRMYATNVPTIGGYMVHESKVEQLETELLSLKGITEEDRTAFPENIVSGAEALINVRTGKLSQQDRDRDIPVTFLGYCSYLLDHYDELVDEIKTEYRERGYVIDDYLPTKKSLERSRFEWFRYAQMPSLMMFGETSLRQIINNREQEASSNQKMQRRMESEIHQLQSQCTEALNSVQLRVRQEVTDELQKLATRLALAPMTESQKEAARASGKQKIKDPSVVTERSIESLQARLQTLMQETAEINSQDSFTLAITQLHETFGDASHNWKSETDRAAVNEQVQQAIASALDDDEIDTNTGGYFRRML